MQRRILAMGSCLAISLAVVGCQDVLTTPTLAPAATLSPRMTSSAELGLDTPLPAGLSRDELFLPSSAEAADLDFSTTANRVINPADYVCSSASPLNNWLNAEINHTLSTSAESARFFALYNRSADLIPTYDALYFQTTATPQTFGYNGEYTKLMTKTERDVKGFWDIPSQDIQVLAMHGSVLLDVARTARTYRLLGLPAATALDWATTIQSALLASTTMDGGNYAFWTFNAVSFKSSDVTIPKKIVMGDGILAGYEALGFDDVALPAIFAHEFAHQIQFEHNYRLPATVSAPERTRYTELMADAMSAYYLTHKRGATMNQKRVTEFLQVFYQIGDCSFTSSGHHGTPNQRMAAAKFGFKVADEAQKQGHILPAAEFYARFVAQYPTIIAPDAH